MEKTFDKIVSHAKTTGFVFQAELDSLQYAQLFRGPRLFIRAGAALLVSLRKLAHSSTVEPL